MDINKEREAFEAHIKSTHPMGEQLAKDCGKTLCELYSSEWQSWQAAIARMEVRINTLDEMLLNQGEALVQAKAQAVPDGFVVVPIEPTKQQIEFVVDKMRLSGGLEMVGQIYESMIEAQEQSNV